MADKPDNNLINKILLTFLYQKKLHRIGERPKKCKPISLRAHGPHRNYVMDLK